MLLRLLLILLLALPAHAQQDLPWPSRFGQSERGSPGIIIPSEHPFVPLHTRAAREAHMQELLAARDALIQATPLAESRPRISPGGPGLFTYAAPAPEIPAAPDPRIRRFRFVSAELSQDQAPADPPRLIIQQTFFTLHLPTTSRPPKAAILIMPGMLATPEPIILALISRLRAADYAVLRMHAHPSRFTERVTFDIDDARADEDLALIARTLDDRAAEAAFAVKAAWDHAIAADAALADLPIFALGMSGGAMILPTVLAYDLDRYTGAILIGGGCNFFAIALRSNYRNLVDAVQFTWTSPGAHRRAPPTTIPAARIAELQRDYLAHAPLDSHATAPLLAGKRLLMLHAAADRAVPADLGDELWTRLGEPERWTSAVGHELLFAALPLRFADLLTWLDAAIAPVPEPARPAPSPSLPR